MHMFLRLLCLGIFCLGMVVPGVASATTVTGEIYFVGGDPINYLSPSVVTVGSGPEYHYQDSILELFIDIDPTTRAVALDATLKGPSVFFPWDLRLMLDELWPALTLLQESFTPGLSFYFEPNNLLRIGWPGGLMLDPEAKYSALFVPERVPRVPEPDTLLLFAAGIAMIYLRRTWKEKCLS